MKMQPTLRSAGLLVVCLIVGGAPLSAWSRSNARDQEVPAIHSEVESFVREHTGISRWRLDRLSITLESSRRNGNAIEWVYGVDMSHRLGYSSPEDVPLLQGKLAWFEARGEHLNGAHLEAARQEIAFWHAELEDYIRTPQNAFERIKATATLRRDGSVDPSSIELWVEDPKGGYDSAEEFLAGIAPPEDIVRDASTRMEEAIGDRPIRVVRPSYSRRNAVAYINTYTSNTSSTCNGGSALQDPSKYSPDYSWYACTDCANYVSQALSRGGIPTTSTWQADAYAWINVDGLKNYMVDANGYWKSVERSSTKKGDIVLLGTPSDYYHTMMITYWDGSTMKYSAHSNDRLEVTFSGTSDASYWQVAY